jgi:hypothetical protein
LGTTETIHPDHEYVCYDVLVCSIDKEKQAWA